LTDGGPSDQTGEAGAETVDVPMLAGF
jgi:hypothetical protein